MKPGESIEIKTPNAITAIRGTVVVAEVIRTGRDVQSTITLLRGLIDVTQLDPVTHQRVGAAVPMQPLHSLSVMNTPLAAPKAITPETAKRLNAEFSLIPGSAPAPGAAPAVRHAVKQAAVDAEALRTAPARAGDDAKLSADGASNGKEKKEKIKTKDMLASGAATDLVVAAPVKVKGPALTAIDSSSVASPVKPAKK
jgi:hypothetical protein